MPNFVTKSISLYYKPHDGLGLNQGNANQLPTSVGPISYYYKLDTGNVNPNDVDCSTTYTTILNLSTTAGIEMPAPLDADGGPGGPGCSNPIYSLSQLVTAGIRLYYNSACTDEADPGKYSSNAFPAKIFDPNDAEDSIVYSYKPPSSVNFHNILFDWETYTIPAPGGGNQNVLQQLVVSPIFPVLVDFLPTLGQVRYKQYGVEPCNFSVPTSILSGVSYFPTEDVPAGSSLSEIAEAGISILNSDGETLSGFFAISSFPSNLNDVTVYKALSITISSTNWESFICTQVVAPDETVREFTVPFAEEAIAQPLNTTDYGEFIDSSLYCSSNTNKRIFYCNDSTEYASFYDLVLANETIYFSNVNLPANVIPQYWQLVDANSASYGINENSYFYFLQQELSGTTIANTWDGPGWYRVTSIVTLNSYINIDTDTDPYSCSIAGLDVNGIRTITLNYADSLSNYCNITSTNSSNSEIVCQYYNPLGAYDLTLDQIIENQIFIYTDSIEYASYYEINNLLLDSGFYGEQPGICYNFNNNIAEENGSPWKGKDMVTTSSEYSLPFVCEGTLSQISLISIGGQTVNNSLGIWNILYPEYDFSDEWCFRQKANSINYYYSLHADLNFDIHQIVQYGITLYKDINLSIPISNDSYSDDTAYYYKWLNNVDETGGNWIGLNEEGQESSAFITDYIECNLTPNSNLFPDPSFEIINQTGISNDGELLAFYVFTSCIPVNGVYSNYIVFGSHTNQVTSGHMFEFAEEIGFNSTFFSFDSTDLKYGCKKLLGRIYASSPAEAAVSMATLGYFQGNTQYVSPNTIGILSEGTVYYFNDEPYCQDCIDFANSNPYTFSSFAEESQNADPLPKFNLEENYNLHNVSKPLLRTNPRLTGNVKLVTSSVGEIYLESINANKELADSRYKRYGVSSDSSYVYDVSRFFNDNRTPYDMVYETKRTASDFSVLESYDLQFEDEYQYGVRFNKSKLYDENFRIFAPIKLDLNIPKSFVIYRISSPKQNRSLNDNASDKRDRISDMLSNATIIKTFDLSETSKLGTYIRHHVFSEDFNSSPLTVSFEKNEQTFYNGIDLVKGGFTNKGEYVYDDYVATDKPLIEANDFITDGFKRNRVISGDIINLEFMFDDIEAEDYSVNRYFGLYVDEIPSGKGKIERVSKGLIKFKDLTSNMYYDNLEGSLFDKNTFAIPSSQMMSDIPVLGYVKCDSHYHNILNGASWDAENYTLKISDNNDSINRYVGIKDTNRTVGLLEKQGIGYDFVKVSINDIPENGSRIAFPEIKQQSYCVEFINHIPNTTIFINISYPTVQTIAVSTGSNTEEALNNIKNVLHPNLFDQSTGEPVLNNSTYFIVDIENNVAFIKERNRAISNHDINITTSNPACVVKVIENYSHFNLLENILTADDSIPKGRFSGSRFSNVGNINDVLIALSSAIKNKDGLGVVNSKGVIYVYSKNNIGYDRRQFGVLIKKDNPNVFCDIDNLDESNRLDIIDDIKNDWNVHYMIGGHSDGKSVLISKDSLGGIKAGEYINTKSTSTYNEVIDIVENIDDITGDYLKIVLKNRHNLGSGEFKVFSEYEAEIGLLSAYDMYDMGYDFYDTSNSDLKELKYETYENTNYVPANEAIFNSTSDEESITNALEGIIEYDYYLTPDEFFTNLIPVLNPESPTEESQLKIYSEYDRLKENQLKEFSTESRIVPNINKWVLKDTKTVRDQPYYLNVNEAFGRTNFSPDVTIEGRDVAAFTHEWFYIANKPEYLKHYMLNETFSYINYINGFKLDKDLFKSIDDDYFNSFMVSEGFDVVVDPDGLKEYVVTKSLNVLFINDEPGASLSLVVGNTYLFNLADLENPSLFNISEDAVGTYVYEVIGGVPYGKYTTISSGFVQYSYDSIEYGNISISNEDLNKFEAFIKTNRNIKYTISRNGNEKRFSSTIFKGLKFTFKNRKEFEENIPSKFVKDGSFNNYKFSTIVDFVTGQNNNSIDYEVIKNDKFEFIIFYITINLDEVYVGNTLNRKLAYLLSNQVQLSGEEYIADDVKINGALDLSNIDFNQLGPYVVSGINHFDGTSPNFITQIVPGLDGTFGQLEIDYQVEDSNGDPVIYYLQPISILSNSQIIVEGPPVDAQGDPINPIYLPLSLQEIATYVYVGGGSNNHNVLLSNLSINNIVDLVNEYSPLVKYVTITEDGQILNNRFAMTIDDGKEIIRKSELITKADTKKPKSYRLFNENIGYVLEKGNSYYPFLIRHSGEYEYDLTPVITFTDVYTHFKVDRNYVKNAFLDEKLFKNKFYRHPSSESDEFSMFGPRNVHKAESYYNKYNRTNVAFNLGFISDDDTHDAKWGMIKNHFYHKVNEDNSTGVTKLSESSEFLPKYPLIGETAIDKRDVNVFRSSWEKDYYRTSLAGGEFISAPGTLSTVESRSYLASTVMKLKESYTITLFDVRNANTVENLNNILKLNSDSKKKNVVFSEDKNKIYVDFYMSDIIVDVLSDSGVADEIKKYVSADISFQDKTDLLDDVRSYIENNLVNLFSVDEVELYVRKTQSESTQINPVESLDQIDNGGFKLDINYTLEPHRKRPINFRLIYNKGLGYSYVMRPVIKIKQ